MGASHAVMTRPQDRGRSGSRLGPILERLWRGERNPWLVYEVAKTCFMSGQWDGLNRAEMRQALARLTQGANPDTVTEGWRDFLLAHGQQLPRH